VELFDALLYSININFCHVQCYFSGEVFVLLKGIIQLKGKDKNSCYYSFKTSLGADLGQDQGRGLS